MRRSSNRAGAGARSTRGARGNPDRRQGVRIEPTRRTPPSARVVSTSAAPPTRPTPSRARRRPSLPRVSCRRASEASRFARPRYHGEASPARGRRPRRTVGGGTVTRPASPGARGADRRGVRRRPADARAPATNPSSRTLAPESDPADVRDAPEAYRRVARRSRSSRSASVPKSELRVWDPYYCEGAVARHLSSSVSERT